MIHILISTTTLVLRSAHGSWVLVCSTRTIRATRPATHQDEPVVRQVCWVTLLQEEPRDLQVSAGETTQFLTLSHE
ncbi:hypothetical protein SPRG_20754 [Saprolegnia parasitica CBS 223.65]|uniref:Secreted protein n=1 Tax=Saprolegnia parasitica (strain CBS 223.65) TaxID=695850 RepID=A0A067C8B6_SAPPC|nr:hypothetical protein SPRG_20754 [Saprolegnia parasitica CBS 223.65]KDO25415.1 hypothetical protein SPRG_20754 [Saprolegnia parasitica CBS 223.65]|eukprot:XP_012203919.1 hypothetical protein SPRG_20754 [Saprolegnia parasitica CBS 223.65]